MLEENKFDLVPVLDSNTGHYVIADYERVVELVKNYANEAVEATAVIADDIAFATAKKARTDLRKHKDAITQARISINALLLGDFNTQLKNIETILDNADKDIKARVDEYNLAKKGNDTGKPKVISLVVKGYDAKAIEKVKAQALKLGLSAEVK